MCTLAATFATATRFRPGTTTATIAYTAATTATTANVCCLYQVERIGQKHQAGSDSLLTAQVFFKIVDVRFNGMSHLDREKYNCELFGYGSNNTVYRPGHVAATPTKSASSAAMANSAAALGNTAVAYAITSNSNGAANLNAAFVANGEYTSHT
jgi:hypothetical protein